MYIHQIHLYYASNSGSATTIVVVRDDTQSITITLTREESAQVEAIGETAYRRSQKALIEKLSAPLETNLLPAPVIEDADFSEVQF